MCSYHGTARDNPSSRVQEAFGAEQDHVKPSGSLTGVSFLVEPGRPRRPWARMKVSWNWVRGVGNPDAASDRILHSASKIIKKGTGAFGSGCDT